MIKIMIKKKREDIHTQYEIMYKQEYQIVNMKSCIAIPRERLNVDMLNEVHTYIQTQDGESGDHFELQIEP